MIAEASSHLSTRTKPIFFQSERLFLSDYCRHFHVTSMAPPMLQCTFPTATSGIAAGQCQARIPGRLIRAVRFPLAAPLSAALAHNRGEVARRSGVRGSEKGVQPRCPTGAQLELAENEFPLPRRRYPSNFGFLLGGGN